MIHCGIAPDVFMKFTIFDSLEDILPICKSKINFALLSTYPYLCAVKQPSA